MPLTDTACKSAKPQEKTYKLADSDSMFLSVRPNGSKYFQLKYRINGKEKLLSLGIYPETTLSEARDKRDEARKLIKQGIDPVQEKQKLKIQKALATENTFKKITLEWHELNKHMWQETHAVNILRRFEKKIFPLIGNRPIAEIESLELLSVIREVEKCGVSNDMAHRALQYCSSVFRYAILTKRAIHNPAVNLKGALKPVKIGHYAALDTEDLPGFLTALNANKVRLYPQTVIAIRLLLLTFVRTTELIKATWKEFNFDDKIWIIPAERMKMKRDHIVPLSNQVIDLLNELKVLRRDVEPDKFIFSGMIDPTKPISNNTILFAIGRLGFKGKHTGHGFRALAATVLQEKLNYSYDVIDRQLAHAPKNKIRAAYDRAKFLDQRKIMMQEWADYISSLS